MKGLLLDENVPNRLTIATALPIVHCRDLGMRVLDSDLWEYARLNEYVIVSKDVDFSNRIMLTDPPPWVVHLRIGNLRRREFHAFLTRVWPQIEALLPQHKLINVYHDRIESVL